MPLINPQQQTDEGRSSLWWPSFDRLYEALREACVSDAPEAVLSLDALLTVSQAWLIQGLLGFEPPSEAAKIQLEREEHIHAADGKRMSIASALKPLAFQLSTYLVGLQLLFCVLLAYRIRHATQQHLLSESLPNPMTTRCRI